jgi:hypothetical protein
MNITKKTETRRSLFSAIAILFLAMTVLWFGAQLNTTEASINNTVLASAPAATFNGSGVGPIPDNGSGCQPTTGPPLNVTFNVSGVSGAVSNVGVSITFGSPGHTWAGDVIATLIAPNGASHTIFGRVGAITEAAVGDSSDLNGTYNFSDGASSPPSGGWWQAATAAGMNETIANGEYRTTNSGGAGATNPMPPTDMNPAFAGVTDANGTWTLRLTDGCNADTGAVSAAVLTIEGSSAPVSGQHVVDFDGDGRTDFSVVRNVGSGSEGQVRWYVGLNGTNTNYAVDWGIASDFFIPADFDGDDKTDIAVWRAGQPGAFYILNSSNNVVRAENFGQTGDDPTVVGDYDGDGLADIAVYRPGANPGDQSLWIYVGSQNNPNGDPTFVPWGQNGDFPAPGDYDGDGRYDFVVQRNVSGSGVFWFNQTSAGIKVEYFGNATDQIVPGDYDGDGKTDLAVIRDVSGTLHWFVSPSTGGSYTETPFGLTSSDFPVPGDYDGDGKTDIAVWRPSATPGQSAFWYQGSTSGAQAVVFGSQGDYPVANYNTH